MKRRVLIIGSSVVLLFILICGFGGYSLYRSLNESANQLGPEFDRAEKNEIPLVVEELHPDKAIPPSENAALVYKEVFDMWVTLRPQIDDDRWQSYVTGKAQGDDLARINQILSPLNPLIEKAINSPQVNWQIDYSDHAFSDYPVFTAVADAGVFWIDHRKFGERAPINLLPIDVQNAFKMSDDLLASNDPGSLRSAAIIRMKLLASLSDVLQQIDAQKVANPSQLFKDFQKELDSVKDIDPLPVWRTTAFLQLDTWENYKNLTPEQKELFATARRDHDVIINAASTEILKFWNTAIEQAEGKPALTQYITLGESVRLLRLRTDPSATPLIKLWSLDSATKGAGSLDWLIANEQLQLTRQALDILVFSNGKFPENFDCKRISVIGQKPYRFERTASGFKLTASPSDILAPDSALAQQKLIYEFRSK